MNINDKKVLRVIKYNENYIKEQEEKGMKDFDKKTGFTTLWHIKMELNYYKEMLGKDKRKLSPHLRELYQSI